MPIIAIGALYADNWVVKNTMDMDTLPDSMTIIFSILFCMMCEDFTFHIGHRIMHWRVIYPYMHKLHHTHIYTVTIAADYTHPIEFIVGNTLPVISGPLILGNKMHLYTFLIWQAIRHAETTDGHSGYEFSWSPYRLLPFSASSTYHSFHHSHNVGNYSSFFSFWDTIFGSNKAYYEYYEQVRKAREEHEKK